MHWVTSITNGNYYNPETHELKAKKDYLEQQIEWKEELIKKLTKRMTEMISDLEEDIEGLKEQLE